MLYECKKCGISTKLKTDYIRHLNTKKHIYSVISIETDLDGNRRKG
jgi:uncharacterized C2H2 Zn-finger protein